MNAAYKPINVQSFILLDGCDRKTVIVSDTILVLFCKVLLPLS